VSALREGKNAVIKGSGGATGGPVARAFARKSALLFVVARTRERLEEVGREIEADTAATDGHDHRVNPDGRRPIHEP
jgi:short-subunit dehydrogenase